MGGSGQKASAIQWLDVQYAAYRGEDGYLLDVALAWRVTVAARHG